jgi:lysophospholipase L1-like esterase
MTIRGRATRALLNRVGRARLLQSLALPCAPGNLVFLGDGLSLHGAWNEWFPESTVRVLGDEALLIEDAEKLLDLVDSPRGLVILLGTADLLGLAGSTSPAQAVRRLDALLAVARQRFDAATIFVVGVPRRPALGDRAAEYNARVEAVATARGVTFVRAPDWPGDKSDGYLVSLIRWDATVYSDLAKELAHAIGITGASGRPVKPLEYAGKGLLVKGQRKRAQLFEALPAPSARVVLYGDSITEGGAWDGWLPGMPIANRGIGGDTIAQLSDRLDTAIDSPLAVSVLAGTNDLQRGEPDDPDSIASRFRELIAQIREREPRVPILINSVMPRAAKFADPVTTINAQYRRIADEFDAHYLDLWPVLAAPDRSLRRELTPDGLHLNGDGYREWTAVLRPALEDIIKREP